MLDAAGFEDAYISASNDLDEYLIHDLKMQGRSSFRHGALGRHLITSKDCPSFGRRLQIRCHCRKDGEFHSENQIIRKTQRKSQIRETKPFSDIYEKATGKIKADLICFADEVIDCEEDLLLFDPVDTWKKTLLKGGTYEVVEFLKPVFINGACVYDTPSVMEIADYCQQGKRNTLGRNKTSCLSAPCLCGFIRKIIYSEKRFIKSNEFKRAIKEITI